MGLFRRKPLVEMPPRPPWREEWDVLARYNAERSRGLAHTPEWNRRMQAIQTEFDREHARYDAQVNDDA